MGVVKEEETTVEPATGISVSVTEPVMMLYPDLPSSSRKSTEMPNLLTSTTPPFLPEWPRSGAVTPEVKLTTDIPETSTLTAEEAFTAGTAATTESEPRPTTTQIPPETSTGEQAATITEKLASTETETSPTATTQRESSTRISESATTNAEREDETTSYEDNAEATTRNPGWSSPERRPKRIRTDGGEEEQGVVGKDGVIHSGQYHEVNPGQYSEQNPGQYHEVNPGQYHEVHPGQVDVESVKVDFQHRSKDRIYNVQASAGDFILGEVGRIDNSGQTLQGVRYTAVEGEVDEARITEILNRYFGARTM